MRTRAISARGSFERETQQKQQHQQRQQLDAPVDAHYAMHEARSPPGQWRTLMAALTAWAITAWAITAPGAGVWLAICSGVLAIALLSYRLWPSKARASRVVETAVSLLLLPSAVVLLVATQIIAAETARADRSLAQAASSGSVVDLTADLTSFPKFTSTAFGERGWLRANVRSQSGSVPIILWLESRETVPLHWAPGTVIEFSARLEAQPPGDAAAYSATPFKLQATKNQPLSAAAGAAAASLRAQLTATADDIDGAELVPGFAVGDTSLVSESLEQAMLASSLTHLTAVSGSNTGLVIAVIVWAVSYLGVGRRGRVIAAIVGLAAFITVVGPDASVQRASAMAAVLLLGNFGGRKSSALASLGVAVVALLALDPWQSLQPGFALSVVATLGILLFAHPTSKWLMRRTRMPRWLALPLAIALTAQLSCGPFLLLLEPGVPAVGVLANLIAAPAAPIGTGFGLLAALLGPIFSPLAHFAALIASFAARWVAATAEVCASLPGGRLSWPGGWNGAVWLAACELALLAAWGLHVGAIGLPWLGQKPRRRPWELKPPSPFSRRLVPALLAAASLATFLGITVASPLTTRLTFPLKWSVVACDVGQGDAVLLRDPQSPKHVMLIDTGDDPNLLTRCLDNFGVDRISILVLSHDDRDHVGALDAILERTDRALLSPSPAGVRLEDREVIRKLSKAKVPFEIGQVGLSTSQSASSLSWNILAPTTETPTDTNAASLVMLVRAGPVRVLLLGDTGEVEQSELLRRQLDLRADVLKVAHHGSSDQAAELPSAVSAQWALISVGADNGYGHPSATVVTNIEKAGTKVLRTDVFGSLALVVENSSLTPWLEHAHQAKHPTKSQTSGSTASAK